MEAVDARVWGSFFKTHVGREQRVFLLFACHTIKTRLERAQIEHEEWKGGCWGEGKIQGFPWTYFGQACI